MKTMIWGGVFVGSLLGGFVPMLWGDSALSFSSVLLSGVGGIVGLFAGYTLARNIGL